MSPRRREPAWVDYPEERLLRMRLSRLGLRVEDPPLGERIDRLADELEAKQLRFRPSIWLSTHWFSPDGVPGFAIPFFLAHPRLSRLERKNMLEVEGGSDDACMRLMRHETAHAIDNAYQLHRRKSWRDHFGKASAPYRATYVPRPGSKRFVQNLENWYAQSHPLEDFAETFAVWLRPRSGWRQIYRDSPALRKLHYIDTLMKEIGPRRPLVRSRERTESLPSLDTTIGGYYRQKKARYGGWDLSVYDDDLRRLFPDTPTGRRRMTAAAFLREHRRDLRSQVSTWTGQYPFVVDQVLGHMIQRCHALGLRVGHSGRKTSEGAAILVTVQTIRYRRYHQEFTR